MGHRLRDGAAVREQDLLKAEAARQLHRSDMFVVSAVKAPRGDGATICSLRGRATDSATFLLTTIAALWNLLLEVTGETHGEIAARVAVLVRSDRALRQEGDTDDVRRAGDPEMGG